MSVNDISIETELLLRLVQNDIKAFDELYWKYQKAVYQNVLKLTKDNALAEDIVQEVFISLWEKRHTIDTSRSVSGWLFVSSYNRSVNALKKKLHESLTPVQIDQISDEPGIESRLEDAQINLLEKAIKELPPQKRRVFELCKLQGKTYEEAARQMNISKHTVKEYLSAAVSFIKEFVRQHPELGNGPGFVLIASLLMVH